MVSIVRKAAGAITLLLLTAQAPPPSADKPPIVVQHVDPTEVVGLLGQSVLGADKNEIGRIVDVLIDGQGTPRAAVLNVGGFLGMGDRSVAVEWSAIHFTPSDKGPIVTLDIPADRIKAAPQYVAGRKVEILTESGEPKK